MGISEKDRIDHLLKHERALWREGEVYIAGVDEAGRGPLAGPVVAGAVIFPENVFIEGIDDSKKLNSKKRDDLFPIILNAAISVGFGIVSEKIIDQINILQASYKAMKIALKKLSVRPTHILVDGYSIPGSSFRQTPLVKGDSRCFSIAAASIIAKVIRDRLMVKYDRLYPQYGFARHKGYCTKRHIEAVEKFGLCKIHRRSFQVKGWDKQHDCSGRI